MPVSFTENKHKVQEWYQRIAPRGTVVDIGPGVGTYAQLIPAAERQQAHWVGVEIWGPYIEEYNLRDWYDNIIVADARYLDFSLIPDIDLVIAGDVLEHMAKEDAVRLVLDWKQRAKNIIISVPIVDIHQVVTSGNVWETHLHQWRFAEMLPLLEDGLEDSVEGENLGYFWWRAANVRGDGQ